MENANRTRQRPLGAIVDDLCRQAEALAPPRNGNGRIVLPSRDAVLACMEGLRAVFFPGYFGAADLSDEHLHYYVGATPAAAPAEDAPAAAAEGEGAAAPPQAGPGLEVSEADIDAALAEEATGESG